MATQVYPSSLKIRVSLALLVSYLLMANLFSQSVTVAWNPNSEPDIAGYNIYRSQQSGAGFAKLNGNLISGTTFTDDSIVAGQTYFYICTAVNLSSQESEFSNEVSHTVPPSSNLPPNAENDSATLAEDTSIAIAVLSNDADPDGDELTVVGTGNPVNGTVTINSNKTITYSPSLNFFGVDAFSYTVSDTGGSTDTAQVTVTVQPVNDAPVASDDVGQTEEETAVILAVLDNDTDPDGDSLIVSSVTAPENGTATIVENNSINYLPATNFSGADSFSYSVSDGAGGSASGVVTVQVSITNDPPHASNDSVSTLEDSAVLVDVLANDTDPDGDPLSITQFSAGAHGTVERVGNALRYTPELDFSGADTFSYTISDGSGAEDTAQANVEVIPVNDPPLAVSDLAFTTENSAVVIAVLNNDTDPDGDPLILTRASTPESGRVTIVEGGIVNYEPFHGFRGTDSFLYTVSDGAVESEGSVEVRVMNLSEASLVVPRSLESNQNKLEGTFVSVALLNSADEVNSVTATGLANSGQVIGDVVLPEPLLPSGQLALLTTEVPGLDGLSETLRFSGQEVMSGFSMVGDFSLARMDAISGELDASNQLYFAPVAHKERRGSETTTLFLFNRDLQSGTDVSLELFEIDGTLLAQTEVTLAPSASLNRSLGEIFVGTQFEDGFLRALSSDTMISGFVVSATDKSIECSAGTAPQEVDGLIAPHFFVETKSGGGSSILRFLNTGSAPVSVELSAFQDDGTVVGTNNFQIGPLSLVRVDGSEIVESRPGNRNSLVVGYVEANFPGAASEGVPVLGTVTFSSSGNKARSTLSLEEKGRRNILIPHVAQNDVIFTGLAILNPGNLRADIELLAFDESGHLRGSRELGVNAGGRIVGLLDGWEYFGSGFTQVGGHLQLTSTQDVITFALFGDSAGTFLSAIDGQ